jgi:uncharacterized membrane protein YphA (DoxX/SURF4 family)
MNNDKNFPQARPTIYWITTIVVALAFLITGIGNLISFDHIAKDMSHLGYPSYFLMLLGTWKILASVTILFPGLPRMKEWAYAGMIFDLTGASFSRYSMGDGILMIVVPLSIAAVTAVSWRLRPEGRTLTSHHMRTPHPVTS